VAEAFCWSAKRFRKWRKPSADQQNDFASGGSLLLIGKTISRVAETFC
jgi:hypothetical protein